MDCIYHATVSPRITGNAISPPYLLWSNFIQDHVEGYLALSGKTKTYFATAVSLWDADFYVKVDDDVHVNIGKSPYLLCPSIVLF